MAIFFIRREAPGLEADDVEAGGLRAAGCAQDYPGLRWIRSYWHRESAEVHCYYEAESEAQIREHSERARMVVSEVREVHDIDPSNYAPPTPPPARVRAGG